MKVIRLSFEIGILTTVGHSAPIVLVSILLVDQIQVLEGLIEPVDVLPIGRRHC